jgi:hypothetical protein
MSGKHSPHLPDKFAAFEMGQSKVAPPEETTTAFIRGFLLIGGPIVGGVGVWSAGGVCSPIPNSEFDLRSILVDAMASPERTWSGT